MRSGEDGWRQDPGRESGKGHTLLYGCQTLSPSVSPLRTPCFAEFLREKGSRETAVRRVVLEEVIWGQR
ncbi:hypothetical protein E2C01_055270 [Portunus trituberculatus]|uniref:Uncharacterized protein n=1 Tax=Portunus trituberculatus TaxID=210409 RepID=A0A5B7GX68_PORTR|nr:hypothetical protein [Portunus trituberculatus]